MQCKIKFSYCAGGLCFCGGKKTRVHYVCLVLIVLWRQEDTSSLCLFSVDSSGRQMIRNFSLRQRLHLLLELLYGECDEIMRQEIKCSMLLSLRVQICLLSSVEFLCLARRNDPV